jgi:hypothetical protein
MNFAKCRPYISILRTVASGGNYDSLVMWLYGKGQNAYRILIGILHSIRPLGNPRKRWEETVRGILGDTLKEWEMAGTGSGCFQSRR